MTEHPWLTQLNKQGYRLTGARRVVAETIANSARALTPIEVYDMAREAYPALGLVTVYRTLEALEEHGLEGWEIVHVLPSRRALLVGSVDDHFTGAYFLLKKEVLPTESTELEKE